MENTTSSESTKARDHLEGHFRMDRSGCLYNTRVQIYVKEIGNVKLLFDMSRLTENRFKSLPCD